MFDFFKEKEKEKEKVNYAYINEFHESEYKEVSNNKLVRRIAEIYALLASSREYYYERNDGIDFLIKNGLQSALFNIIFHAILNDTACIRLITADSPNPSEPLAPKFNHKFFSFGEVRTNIKDFEGIHPSRILEIKSCFKNIEELKNTSLLYSEALEELKKFLKINNLTTLSISHLSSSLDVKAKDIEALKANFKGAFKNSDRIVLLGQGETVQNLSRSAESLKDVFEAVKDDVVLTSGVPRHIIFGGEEFGDSNLFLITIEGIANLMIRPFLNNLLNSLSLLSNFDFKPLKLNSEKEVAELECRQAETLKMHFELINQIEQSSLEEDIKENFRAQINNYLKNI